MITFEEVNKLLEYDRETGILKWRVNKGRARIGMLADHSHDKGYLRIQINGRRWYAHQLVWLLFYKILPSGEIDHINRITSDNRIDNLRIVSHSCNMKNRSSSSSHMGVDYCKKLGKWRAQIRKDNKSKHLGYFIDMTDAIIAYRNASMELFPEINGGL